MMREPTTNDRDILGAAVCTVETIALERGADLGGGKFDGGKNDTLDSIIDMKESAAKVAAIEALDAETKAAYFKWMTIRELKIVIN